MIRWRIDRMGALKARARTADVINEYQKLQSQGVKIPTYALRWVAASYLDQRQPEVSTDLYRQVLSAPDADVGDRLEDTTALYYSLLESDRADEARNVAEDLAKTQKPRVELKGLPIGNPNDEWMDAQQLAAQAGTYGSDLPHGEERLQTLVDQAPATSACVWRRPICTWPGNGHAARKPSSRKPRAWSRATWPGTRSGTHRDDPAGMAADGCADR